MVQKGLVLQRTAAVPLSIWPVSSSLADKIDRVRGRRQKLGKDNLKEFLKRECKNLFTQLKYYTSDNACCQWITMKSAESLVKRASTPEDLPVEPSGTVLSIHSHKDMQQTAGKNYRWSPLMSGYWRFQIPTLVEKARRISSSHTTVLLGSLKPECVSNRLGRK